MERGRERGAGFSGKGGPGVSLGSGRCFLAGHHRISAGSRSAPYRLVDVGCDWHRFEQLCRLAVTEDEDDRSRLLRAALSLVRTPPFDVSRPGAFHWASDLCFDSRMRLKISEAARHLEADTDDPDSNWARDIRLSVTRND